MNGYSSVVCMDESKKKKWDECDPQVKETVMRHLKDYTKHISLEHTVDILCCALSDIYEKLDRLENKTPDQS